MQEKFAKESRPQQGGSNLSSGYTVNADYKPDDGNGDSEKDQKHAEPAERSPAARAQNCHAKAYQQTSYYQRSAEYRRQKIAESLFVHINRS